MSINNPLILFQFYFIIISNIIVYLYYESNYVTDWN